ncbi:hypothetical protein PIB30_017892 [Stylosanthes scabra]|uniref:J domain-containing protein n=1 Tax=Stylosanthes scabra TaxID=79078 RepID=A0ABU6Z695_9FABA|nr:hypothetical protein [Stylosanthes scabra]
MSMAMSASTWLIPTNPIPMARTQQLQLQLRNKNNRYSTITRCKASSWMTSELDLYELLGIDNSSDHSEVKRAYRSLQKRCHPDIAGPAGHDMSIILNQAYAILSDPNARRAYDKEQAKISEFKGFTGRPLYSVWRGSETEQRAIFVDEIKCVGCLKCALLAHNTFAIESVYGRARVVAQWADSHHKIQDAIDSCPVNCISVVERSNLAALEFLMSKQPRGNVRVGAGNTAGVRVSNIFVDVDKFQKRFQETMDKASNSSKDTDLQRESRMSAIQAIRSISNWLYWQAPSATENYMTRVTYKLPEPDIAKLRDAAARKKVRDHTPQEFHPPQEYWSPSTYVLPSSTSTTPPTPAQKPISATKGNNVRGPATYEYDENQNSPIRWGFPMVTALIAVATIRLNEAELVPEVKQHIAGNLALEIVNSPWMQYILAAATWYMIGMAIIELVAIIGNKDR